MEGLWSEDQGGNEVRIRVRESFFFFAWRTPIKSFSLHPSSHVSRPVPYVPCLHVRNVVAGVWVAFFVSSVFSVEVIGVMCCILRPSYLPGFFFFVPDDG